VRPPSPTNLWTRLKRASLGFDAWLNSSLYESGRSAGAFWSGYSRQMNRLRVRGAKRVLLDLTSEAATLGAAGAVVMLGLAIPAFRETSENWLKTQELAVTFLDRYGQEIGRRGLRLDDSYKLEDYPDTMIKAALATEDRRFYEHWGIDPIGTFRALTVNARGGGTVQGGSSITQQLAKNLFLSREKTYARKVKEAFLTLGLESSVPKERLLEVYFNIIEWGPDLYGIGEAARHYFDKDARELSIRESAFLATIIPNPVRYHVYCNRGELSDIWKKNVEGLLAVLLAGGDITEAEYQEALAAPLVFAGHHGVQQPSDEESSLRTLPESN
jgi:penicillin-binding protein 1A